MIQENRRLWKLILLTIPTFGIYNIYFWFRLTQDLNEMNQNEKRLCNYILVCFLSIITLGIYRWVWFFWVADRIQVNGEKYGIKLSPGPGVTLAVRLFGTFAFVVGGQWLSDLFVIHNMNKLAVKYNTSLKQNTKVIKKE